jgi:natural product biosynthesis luciferase-like monooxygenase protein
VGQSISIGSVGARRAGGATQKKEVLAMTNNAQRFSELSFLSSAQRENQVADENSGVTRHMDFSLFYFASADGGDSAEKYRLLIEGAKFADTHGFAAVWTPERHFHEFGGLYPNPSVTSAALATVTERIQIRAGSVVLPLHDPLLVAEEWAVVDNLSHGRAAVSFASGWHANDFVIAPQNYATRKEVMLCGIETVRRLWRGGKVRRRDGNGTEIEVGILPRPIQRELPIWVTASGSPDTFRSAGAIGANLLTHFLTQTIEQLAEKIALYRGAWKEHGHGPGTGHVTLMLHTFVGSSVDEVREKVRGPFSDYLRSSVDLWLARSPGQDIGDFTEEELEDLVSYAFDRYFETSGLFGTPSTCLEMIARLKSIGVDEVGCLIDFGVDFDSVIASLHYLETLRELSNTSGGVVTGETQRFAGG